MKLPGLRRTERELGEGGGSGGERTGRPFPSEIPAPGLTWAPFV